MPDPTVIPISDNPVLARLLQAIARGRVASRADAEAWLRDAGAPLPVETSIDELLAGGFIAVGEETLRPTPLGRTTGLLRVRIATAQDLERWLSSRPAGPASADALERAILEAVCSLAHEWEDWPYSAPADRLRRIRDTSGGRAGWGGTHVTAFALLSGLLAGLLEDERDLDLPAAARSAALDIALRLLRFVAQRANERLPGDPTLVVAATDMALCLDYGVSERGAGALLEAISWAYRHEPSPREIVARTYAGLRALHIDSLTAALPHLHAVPQLLEGTQPQDKPRVAREGSSLLVSCGTVRKPVRVHVRAEGQREALWGGVSADLNALPIADLTDLGLGGEQPIVVEMVTSGPYSPAIWSYRTAGATLTLPEPLERYDQVDGLLRSCLPSGADPSWDAAYGAPTIERFSEGDIEDILARAPDHIVQAGQLLLDGIVEIPERVFGVAHYLKRRLLGSPATRVRPWALCAGARELSRSEGALLAAAFLRSTGVEARVVRAVINSGPSLLCLWLYGGHWYAQPVWRTELVWCPGYPRLAAWPEGYPRKGPPPPRWSVLREYAAIASRRSLLSALPVPGKQMPSS